MATPPPPTPTPNATTAVKPVESPGGTAGVPSGEVGPVPSAGPVPGVPVDAGGRGRGRGRTGRGRGRPPGPGRGGRGRRDASQGAGAGGGGGSPLPPGSPAAAVPGVAATANAVNANVPTPRYQNPDLAEQVKALAADVKELRADVMRGLGTLQAHIQERLETFVTQHAFHLQSYPQILDELRIANTYRRSGLRQESVGAGPRPAVATAVTTQPRQVSYNSGSTTYAYPARPSSVPQQQLQTGSQSYQAGAARQPALPNVHYRYPVTGQPPATAAGAGVGATHGYTSAQGPRLLPHPSSQGLERPSGQAAQARLQGRPASPSQVGPAAAAPGQIASPAAAAAAAGDVTGELPPKKKRGRPRKDPNAPRTVRKPKKPKPASAAAGGSPAPAAPGARPTSMGQTAASPPPSTGGTAAAAATASPPAPSSSGLPFVDSLRRGFWPSGRPITFPSPSTNTGAGAGATSSSASNSAPVVGVSGGALTGPSVP